MESITGIATEELPDDGEKNVPRYVRIIRLLIILFAGAWLGCSLCRMRQYSIRLANASIYPDQKTVMDYADALASIYATAHLRQFPGKIGIADDIWTYVG